MKRAKVSIDVPHSQKLLEGKAVAIKVPPGAQVIELRLAAASDKFSFAQLCDVFFNGRPA
jgi:hypothetical protein